ncbi:MAG: polysaccharide export protein [Lutibacter sp.]|nr:polysaccharide export protein [Lutibacter sp.]
MLFSIALLSVACVPSKKMIYFQEIENVKIEETVVNYEPKLQVGDMLNISVSAIDIEAVQPFNLFVGSGDSATAMSYLVNIDGELNFPVLGKIKVEGFTNKEVTDLLTKRLSDYIKNPVVNVRLINFKVSVLGEVRDPGTYPVTNERISIIEALSLAGDLTIQGKRANVLLVREEQGKRVFVNIDLTNKQLFNSPYYYLAQNDVVYVAPNKTKINNSGIGTSTGIIFSAISVLISLIAILTR